MDYYIANIRRGYYEKNPFYGLNQLPKFLNVYSDKFYYEINPSHINREMLMVTRISKTLNGIGYGGQKINSQVLRWQKKNNKIFLN